MVFGMEGVKRDKSKRYKKISFLGEGQFATVYKAEDTENDGRIVAVKKNICSQKTCYNGGSCQVVNSTSFECICSEKYTGLLCEIPLNLENLGSTNNPAFSCKQLVEKYPNTPTGLYWLNFTLPHVQVICEMTTSGGGWMKIGFVKVNESTVQAFSVVNDVKEDLMALYNVSTGTFLLGGESIAKLRSLLKFTQLRIKCYKSSVNRSFHIMTTEDALGDDVIRFVTGQSDSRPTACGSFVRLNDDDSILSQNCNKWGNNRWSATLLSDVTISSVPVKARLYTYVVTMVQLHHVNLLARDVVECDDVSTDSTGGVNVFRGEGIWEYFIKLGHRIEAKDGINRTALREIKLLQELHHPNVIGLLDVFGHKSSISLVMDFMDTDLEVIIKDTSLIISPAHIKSFTLMALQGLEYLHNNWILHRDMKPNNLLLDKDGILKIGDFGLAKTFGSPNRVYTHQVVTRWYRSPELLFGAKNYGTGIDMWAAGCILAELLLRVPFLPGETDLGQLSKIFETLGTPTEKDWPGITDLVDYVEFKKFPRIPFSEIFSAAGDDLLDLLDRLFDYCPTKRINATNALKHSYFSNRPPPTPGQLLPRPGLKNDEDKVKSTSNYMKRKASEVIGPDITAKKLIF